MGKMRRAHRFAMTPPPSTPPQPAAVTAFLRGVDRRAHLLVHALSGDPVAAGRALAAASRVFATDAGHWPIAQWPLQFWRLLLNTPALRHGEAGADSPLPAISRLAPHRRIAVLLQLVAGLSEADATQVLGIELSEYHARIRDALPHTPQGQPDVDTWRQWRAAVQRALDTPLPAPATPASAPVPAARTRPTASVHTRRLRWLWLGVLGCALALLATFLLHPRGRALLDVWFPQVRREALPPPAAPKARFDADDITLAPDRAMLEAPGTLALARQLPLLAWLAATPDALPTPPGPAPSQARADPATPVQRLRAWQRLPVHEQAARRGAWAEWQALTADERTLLEAVAARFQALPDAQRAALRERYAQQSFDAHRGWHLGPQLGRDWPRIGALFAFIPPSQRLPLLQLLRTASREEIDAMARLAQTTAPEARADLRSALLAQPPSQRAAWLRAQLQN